MSRMLARVTLPDHTLTSANPWLPEGDDGASGGGGGDGQQDNGADHWKSQARTWESRANADKAAREKAEAELAKVRKANQSAEEKALEAARDEGRKAALAEVATERVATRLEAVLSSDRRGVSEQQRKALLARINVTSFLDAEGRLDDKAITEWANEVAPERTRDFGQGRDRGGNAKTTDMSSLIREQVAKRR